MFSLLNNMKKYNRKLYDQVEKSGTSGVYKEHGPKEEPVPKFNKLKNLMKKG